MRCRGTGPDLRLGSVGISAVPKVGILHCRCLRAAPPALVGGGGAALPLVSLLPLVLLSRHSKHVCTELWFSRLHGLPTTLACTEDEQSEHKSRTTHTHTHTKGCWACLYNRSACVWSCRSGSFRCVTSGARAARDRHLSEIWAEGERHVRDTHNDKSSFGPLHGLVASARRLQGVFANCSETAQNAARICEELVRRIITQSPDRSLHNLFTNSEQTSRNIIVESSEKEATTPASCCLFICQHASETVS